MASGSGGTERSHSTPHNSAASSARLSTSSTNPSSIDARSDYNAHSAGTRPPTDIPTPAPVSARSGFLNSPASTFSFGLAKNSRGSPTSPINTTPSFPDNTRNRTVTSSTASTATPPKLFDSDLVLDNSELDGFGNMFDHIGSSPAPDPTRLINQEVQAN